MAGWFNEPCLTRGAEKPSIQEQNPIQSAPRDTGCSLYAVVLLLLIGRVAAIAIDWFAMTSSGALAHSNEDRDPRVTPLQLTDCRIRSLVLRAPRVEFVVVSCNRVGI